MCGALRESDLEPYFWIPLVVQTIVVAGLLVRSARRARARAADPSLFPMYFWLLVALVPFWAIRWVEPKVF